MGWIEPKTDWTSESYFNAEDYNRIVGNVAHLTALRDTLFALVKNIPSAEEKAVGSLIYAKEINAIEEAVAALNLSTYNFDAGDQKDYMANTKTIDWVELNRIEAVLLLLHDTMVAHKNALHRLAFILGGEKGIRV